MNKLELCINKIADALEHGNHSVIEKSCQKYINQYNDEVTTYIVENRAGSKTMFRQPLPPTISIKKGCIGVQFEHEKSWFNLAVHTIKIVE